MSYFPKRVVATQGVPLLALDAISVAVSFWTALVFRFDGQIPAEVPALCCWRCPRL